jgi:hypothetical protein
MKTISDYYTPADPISRYYPPAGSDNEEKPLPVENPNYWRKWITDPNTNEQPPPPAVEHGSYMADGNLITYPLSESSTDYVTSLYQNLLHRDPDQEGLQSWLDYISGGGTFAQTYQGFLGSQEYLHLHDLSNGSLVPKNPEQPLTPPSGNPNPHDPASPVNPRDPNSLAGELGSLFDLLNLSQLAHDPATASGGQDKGGYLVVPTASPEAPTSATYGPKIFLILAIAGIAVTIFLHFHDKGK